MLKNSHCTGEARPDETSSLPAKSKRRLCREHDDTGRYKHTDENPHWLFGNLFECRSGNENCPHVRVPYGGSFYCAWPLNDTSADYHHQPPCLWDKERNTG